MCRLIRVVLAIVVAAGLVGCSRDPDKGVNRGKDKPEPAEKKDKE